MLSASEGESESSATVRRRLRLDFRLHSERMPRARPLVPTRTMRACAMLGESLKKMEYLGRSSRTPSQETMPEHTMVTFITTSRKQTPRQRKRSCTRTSSRLSRSTGWTFAEQLSIRLTRRPVNGYLKSNDSCGGAIQPLEAPTAAFSGSRASRGLASQLS